MVWIIGEGERKDLDDIAKFLVARPLSYPNYNEWADKSLEQIKIGDKQIVIARNNGIYLGHCIYQVHPSMKNVGEIKNLRVEPIAFGQGVGDFLLKQAEFSLRSEVDVIWGDVRVDQSQVIKLLERNNYQKTQVLNLYGNGLDIVYVKQFKTKRVA